jgi:hypothetical protein
MNIEEAVTRTILKLDVGITLVELLFVGKGVYLYLPLAA